MFEGFTSYAGGDDKASKMWNDACKSQWGKKFKVTHDAAVRNANTQKPEWIAYCHTQE